LTLLRKALRRHPQIAERVGAAALGATAFILTSSDNGGDNKTKNLLLFQMGVKENYRPCVQLNKLEGTKHVNY
jgi:hypothetical protein